MTRVTSFFFALAASSMALGACATPCEFTSPCPSDSPPSQTEREQCRATLQANESSPCYGEALALTTCRQNNIVCGGSGRTDVGLSATSAANNCSNEEANRRACCSANSGASACRSL